jgi:fermentation-respiration switch protein FrsA (DUF1100 family)
VLKNERTQMGQVADRMVFPLANGDKEEEVDNLQWIENDDNQYAIPIIEYGCETPNLVIVYSHGNAETLHMISPYLKSISEELNANVIGWEYAGYGAHKHADNSQPSEENVYRDIETVLKYALQQYPETPLVVWGRSLGSAPSVHGCVCFEGQVHRLILESGFRSCVSVVRPHWFAASIQTVFDMFNNEKEIACVKNTPTLFVHGKEDCVIPPEHSQILYNICKAPKEIKWIEKGTHNNIDSNYRDELFETIKYFITKETYNRRNVKNTTDHA